MNYFERLEEISLHLTALKLIGEHLDHFVVIPLKRK